MDILKYVITIHQEPILFSRKLFHNEITTISVISAGFLIINFDEKHQTFKVLCFGESTTLKLNSDPINDKEIIEQFLNKFQIAI